MWWLDLYPNYFAHHTFLGREVKPTSARWSVPAARRGGRGLLSPEGIYVTRKKWPTAFPPLNDLADDDAYARALECHLLGYSEYLAALIYDREGKLYVAPAFRALVPVKLVEDLKIRIDQTIVECVARVKAQNVELQETLEAYYPPGTGSWRRPTGSSEDTPPPEPRSTRE